MSLQIMITFVFKGKLEATKISSEATCAEVRCAWEKLFLLPSKEYFFFIGRVGRGTRLPMEGRITEFLSEDLPTITISVEVLHRVTVRAFGSEAYNFALEVHWQTSIEEVQENIRKDMGVADERRLRLWSDGHLLADDQTLLPPDCHTLFADLEMTVLLLDTSSEDAELCIVNEEGPAVMNFDLSYETQQEAAERKESLPLLPISRVSQIFASDSIAHLFCFEVGEGQRFVTLSGFTANVPLPLANLLSPEDLLKGNVLISKETMMSVQLDDRIQGCIVPLRVWPSSRVKDFLKDAAYCLLIDGESVDEECTFHELGLMNGSCFTLTELVTIRILDSRSRYHTIVTDLHQPANDLYESVLKLEPSGSFELWADGRCLSKETRTLAQLGVTQVKVVLQCREVLVKLTGHPSFRLDQVHEGTRFSDFLTKASEGLGVTLPFDTRFHCACGRVFSNESEARRVIPIRCCNSTVLELEARVPQDRQFQGRWTRWAFRLDHEPDMEAMQRCLSCKFNPIQAAEEEELIRNILKLERATSVQKIRVPERLEVLVQIDANRTIAWSVRSDQKVYDWMLEMQSQMGQTFQDVAVRNGSRGLRLQTNQSKTFTDFKIRRGQLLTLVPNSSEGMKLKH